MQFEFAVRFYDGSRVEGSGSDPADLAHLRALVDAHQRGHVWLTVGLPDARQRTVGDVETIELRVSP